MYKHSSKSVFNIEKTNVVVYLLIPKINPLLNPKKEKSLFIRFDIEGKIYNPHIWGRILNNIAYLAKQHVGKIKIKELYLSVANSKQSKFCKIFIKKNNLFNGAIFCGNYKLNKNLQIL